MNILNYVTQLFQEHLADENDFENVPNFYPDVIEEPETIFEDSVYEEDWGDK